MLNHTQKAPSGATVSLFGEPHPDRAQGAGFAGRQISSRYSGVREYIKARIAIEDRGHETPCWIWQKALDAYGYAQALMPFYNKVAKVHRCAYEAFVGPFPPGLVADHLCRNRNCVNPSHIEPVTNEENVRRGKAAQKWTHCSKGHPLDGGNLTPGSRSCRTCKREWYLANRPRILAALKAERAAARETGGEGLHTGSGQDVIARRHREPV